MYYKQLFAKLKRNTVVHVIVPVDMAKANCKLTRVETESTIVQLFYSAIMNKVEVFNPIHAEKSLASADYLDTW